MSWNSEQSSLEREIHNNQPKKIINIPWFNRCLFKKSNLKLIGSSPKRKLNKDVLHKLKKSMKNHICFIVLLFIFPFVTFFECSNNILLAGYRSEQTIDDFHLNFWNCGKVLRYWLRIKFCNYDIQTMQKGQNLYSGLTRNSIIACYQKHFIWKQRFFIVFMSQIQDSIQNQYTTSTRIRKLNWYHR